MRDEPEAAFAYQRIMKGDAVKPPPLWREELRRAWRELRGADLSPGRAAAAVALGLFIGSQPIFGCHTPLVLAICLVLRLDAAVAWVASNISNPFFAPFLLTAEVQVGGILATGESLAFSPELARDRGIADFVSYAFIGAPLVGLSLAIIGGSLVYLGMMLKRRLAPTAVREPYRLPDHAPAWWHAAEGVANRFAPRVDQATTTERGNFHYVRIKLLSDPVCKLIAGLAGTKPEVLGQVLDIGTGRGQLPLMLLELGRATGVQGFDWDEDKIKRAQSAAAEEPALAASFSVADMTDQVLPPADTVLLIDVIHYLSIEEQDALLLRAGKAVKPGGRLVVREADAARGWRSWATLLAEKFFTFIRFNRGKQVRFRAAHEITEQLEEAGLRCEVRPAWGKMPFSNVLIVGQRQS